MLIQVSASGTIGKQTMTSAQYARLNGITLSPSGANARIRIRDGYSSGEIVFAANQPSAQGSKFFEVEPLHKFTKGMHVTVVGGTAYLNIT